MPKPVTESSELDEILLDFFNETYQDVQATNSSTVYTKAGTHAKAKLKDLIARERQKAVEAKDNAYYERDQLVAALSKIYPAWLGYHKGEWEDDWRNIVYIKIPIRHQVSIGGLGMKEISKKVQVSWHIHDRELKYFSHLKNGTEKWDGHDTEEKYRRLSLLATQSNKGEAE
jgi:hypothetical protein